jgi:hypothetical protein
LIAGRQYYCGACVRFNKTILERLLELENSEQVRRTHYFAGRYENLYVDKDYFDGLDYILDQAVQQASTLLNISVQDLKIGFWFNLMRQGDVTLEHRHDDDDELLSGTYYINVPPDSGKLILIVAGTQKTFEPEEGLFVFFDPRIPHAVTEHQDEQLRLSIGFNIGPAVQASYS